MGRDGHALPHMPQCETAVFTSTSQPFVGLPSQSPNPAAHEVTAQRPIAQAGTALGGLQTVLHAPQFERSVASSTSQPLSGLPSQSAKPALHANSQRPDEHDERALGRAAHAAPQAPQFIASVSVFVSHPLPGARSQSA